jgi:hypothetical protein
LQVGFKRYRRFRLGQIDLLQSTWRELVEIDLPEHAREMAERLGASNASVTVDVSTAPGVCGTQRTRGGTRMRVLLPATA